MKKYLLVIIAVPLLFILYQKWTTKIFHWEEDTIETEIIHIKAEPAKLTRAWIISGFKMLNFRITFTNKTSQKIYFHPLWLEASGFEKPRMLIYPDGIHASYFVSTKWYIEPHDEWISYFYIAAEHINWKKKSNLKLYDMKMNGESLAQIADRK